MEQRSGNCYQIATYNAMRTYPAAMDDISNRLIIDTQHP